METQKNRVPLVMEKRSPFYTARPRGTDGAKVIQAIETKALKGSGTEEDPCYIATQYWSLDGELLAERA